MISPLLANLYLHTVLDQWFEREIKPRLFGRGFLVRFADDAVLGFSSERDARRVFSVLLKRFARFGLELHPTKTQLIEFKPPCQAASKATFDFLGFTHYWGRSRKGRWMIQRKTARDRLRRALKAIAVWCHTFRHRRLADQHRVLCRKLQGHYTYYGLSGNSRALRCLRFHAECLWIKWLRRRSQRARFGWDKAQRLLARYPLPPPRIVVRAIV